MPKLTFPFEWRKNTGVHFARDGLLRAGETLGDLTKAGIPNDEEIDIAPEAFFMARHRTINKRDADATGNRLKSDLEPGLDAYGLVDDGVEVRKERMAGFRLIEDLAATRGAPNETGGGELIDGALRAARAHTERANDFTEVERLCFTSVQKREYREACFAEKQSS